MEITDARDLLFTPDDAANWAAFLNTPTGQRLIPKIAELAPRLLAKGKTNTLLINHGTVLGFSAAVQALLDLSVAKQVEPLAVDNFQPLPHE